MFSFEREKHQEGKDLSFLFYLAVVFLVFITRFFLFLLLYDFCLSYSSFPFLFTSLLCPRLPFRKVKSVLEFIGPCWSSHFKRTVSFYTEDSHSKVPWLIPKNHWNNEYFCQNHTCCNNWLILFLILWNTAPEQTILLCHDSVCVCVCTLTWECMWLLALFLEGGITYLEHTSPFLRPHIATFLLS